MNFFDSWDPFLVLELSFSQNLIPIGLQGTLYEPLECWETVVKPLKIRKSNLETFGLFLLSFMALGVKFLQSTEFLCRNGPHKAIFFLDCIKKEVRSLVWPLKLFWPF
jgi:hypothetical protein